MMKRPEYQGLHGMVKSKKTQSFRIYSQVVQMWNELRSRNTPVAGLVPAWRVIQDGCHRA